ncbi:MAG: class I SAM-dependent methyltransferase [Bacteroidales bacterium]|nr:class I SAM-dependent methyltransferase [Bacteroidales bacterium]
MKVSKERMPDIAFKIMNIIFKIVDFLFPYVDKRINKFGLKEGNTVVDYGCGPGRYTIRFSKIVGTSGKVYAVDIHELAIEKVIKKSKQNNLNNIETSLATGYEHGKYDCGLPDKVADMVCALDMFFSIKDPNKFLKEIYRILKDEGIFILDFEHQGRIKAKEKIRNSGLFDILEENKDHLKLKMILT